MSGECQLIGDEVHVRIGWRLLPDCARGSDCHITVGDKVGRERQDLVGLGLGIGIRRAIAFEEGDQVGANLVEIRILVDDLSVTQ